MPYDPHRAPAHRPHVEPPLRELLSFLRDTFRDAAARIDHYLGEDHNARDERDEEEHYDAPPHYAPAHEPRSAARRAPPPRNAPMMDVGTRMPLESLRDEARRISTEAGDMDPAELRLRIEAVTAETRSIQNRASDPEDKDIAAKILRALTAIVSEYRPGHVYGLARHHQADWDEVGRRARLELATANREPRPPRE